MDLDQVAGELGDALRAGGLRVAAWGVETVHPPVAIVTLPELIEYDQTAARGIDRYPDLPVVVLVSAAAGERQSRQRLAAYADGTGPLSVKRLLEAYTYTSCDDVHVATCEFDTARYAGVDYVAAIFHCSITGKGA